MATDLTGNCIAPFFDESLFPETGGRASPNLPHEPLGVRCANTDSDFWTDMYTSGRAQCNMLCSLSILGLDICGWLRVTNGSRQLGFRCCYVLDIVRSGLICSLTHQVDFTALPECVPRAWCPLHGSTCTVHFWLFPELTQTACFPDTPGRPPGSMQEQNHTKRYEV